MRFSAFSALCAAPLALAGTLQADLVARGEVDASVLTDSSTELLGDGGRKSDYDSNRNGDIIQESTSITEIIIIWVNNGGGAPTSTLQTQTTIAGAAAPGTATHSVVVGGPAGLVYTPDSVNAAVGDMVIFTFLEQNHTVTQAAFTTPCEALAGGMDSGFMPNLNSSVNPPPQMAMQVTVATPIWFYCRQKGHCGKGMVFSINPTQNKTQAMFQQMAIAQNGTGTIPVIAGGSATSSAATGSTSTLAIAGSAATSSNSGALTSGSGSLDSTGNCQCSCFCGQASFPSANQGIDAFGGIPGAMPLSALMTT